jgi:hypothetical protein
MTTLATLMKVRSVVFFLFASGFNKRRSLIGNQSFEPGRTFKNTILIEHRGIALSEPGLDRLIAFLPVLITLQWQVDLQVIFMIIHLLYLDQEVDREDIYETEVKGIDHIRLALFYMHRSKV